MDLILYDRQYSFAASPQTWGTPIYSNTAEPDDELHDPNSNPKPRSSCSGGGIFTIRGLVNLGTMLLVILIVLGVL